MSVQKMSNQRPINAGNPALATTSSVATDSSAKNMHEQSELTKEVSSRAQEEVEEMIANYQRDADKDNFTIPPATPRIREILKKDPLAIWKALHKM